MKSIKIKIFCWVFLTLTAFNASAQKVATLARDPELLQSSQCAALFKTFERKYNIPGDLLHSISLQESGRKHSKLNKTIPWPWTVNIEGKGYYFDSKVEAVNFVKQQRAFGKRSIDVGCMQINLHHHPEAFKSINEAFEPKNNIEYGAIFLKEKYDQYGTWKKAVANYHSADEVRGTNYHKSVLKIASNIDKHKFDTIRSLSMLTPGKPLISSSYKPIPLYNKKARYRSNMMIHIPRNAYKRLN